MRGAGCRVPLGTIFKIVPAVDARVCSYPLHLTDRSRWSRLESNYRHSGDFGHGAIRLAPCEKGTTLAYPLLAGSSEFCLGGFVGAIQAHYCIDVTGLIGRGSDEQEHAAGRYQKRA